jgi:hypothetical protein
MASFQVAANAPVIDSYQLSSLFILNWSSLDLVVIFFVILHLNHFKIRTLVADLLIVIVRWPRTLFRRTLSSPGTRLP